MRLKLSTILAILAVVSITTCAPDIIGPTCRKIPTEISPKLDAAYNIYYKVLYSHGCQPVVLGKYTFLLSDKILKPALNDISHNLKMQPNHRKSLLRITNKTIKAVEANCGQVTKKVEFCKNTKAFPKYTEWTKGQIFSVVISHTQKAGPLLNKNAYRKEIEYLEKRELWEETLPSYIKDFVDSYHHW